MLVDDAFREAFFDILRDKLRDAFRDVCFDTIRTLLACSLLLRCFERATPWLIVLHLKPAEPTIFCYFISNASIFKQRLLVQRVLLAAALWPALEVKMTIN